MKPIDDGPAIYNQYGRENLNDDDHYQNQAVSETHSIRNGGIVSRKKISTKTLP